MDTNYRTQIRKELGKTGFKVIFTSAIKLKNILCNSKSKLLPNSYYLGVYELGCDCLGNTLEKQKNVGSLNQLNPKKIA